MDFFPADIDKYYTIKKNYGSKLLRTEIKVKGSKFIATIQRVSTKEEAIAFVDKMRAEFYDATHNCYAYRIGWKGSEFRAADDGEPSGSAGKPILLAIDKYNLQDVVVVVTRYFGGTKLGVGGLVRAYSKSAEKTLEIIEKSVIHRTKTIKVAVGYEDISFMKRQIEGNAISFTEEYTEKVEFLIEIPLSKAALFVDELFSQSNGTIVAKIIR